MIATSDSESGLAPAAMDLSKFSVSVDTRGRVRVSADQRRLILAEFERSGQTVPEFAKRAGLKYSTLAAWVQRHLRPKGPARPAPVRLLEAVVSPGSANLPVVLHLPGGARLEWRETSQLPMVIALIRALEKSC